MLFVNTVYKLFKRLFSYTRLNAKLRFGKTSFVSTADSVCQRIYIGLGLPAYESYFSKSLRWDTL